MKAKYKRGRSRNRHDLAGKRKAQGRRSSQGVRGWRRPGRSVRQAT